MRKIPTMESLVRSRTTTLEGMTFIWDDGSPVGVLESSGDPDKQGLVSEYEIYRGALSEILAGLSKEVGGGDDGRVKYIVNEEIESLHYPPSSASNDGAGDGPLTVEFKNGTPAATYDLIIACDGATSRTRAMAFNVGAREYVEGINSWTAYFTINKDLLKGSKIANGYSAPGGRFMTLHPDPEPSKVGAIITRVYLKNQKDATRPFRTAMREGDAELKAFIRKEFGGENRWRYDEILAEMQEATDLYASETLRVLAPSLSRGRVVLVGDAGYAAGPTGGGTSLALCGAYMLAGELLTHPGDVAAALKAYEDRMRPIIDDLQKVPPGGLSILAPQSAWAIWLRNTVMGWVVWSGIIGFVQRNFAAAFAEGEKWKLPEYEWPN